MEPLRRHTTRETTDHGSRKVGEAGLRVSKTKRDQRERRQRSIERRRLLVGLGFVMVAIAVAAALVALSRAPIFPVRTVEVTGTHRMSSEQVLAEARVPADTTLLRVPAGKIERALETEPWVASATIVRHFPATLEIRIAERTPAAIVDAGGTHLWLVDGSGVWLAGASAEPSSTLPSIRDIEGLTPKPGQQSSSILLRNALQVWQGMSPELRVKVRTISAPTIDRTALILAHGVQVFVGSSEDIAKKDTVARAILAQHKNVVYVNVRVVDRATWRGLSTPN